MYKCSPEFNIIINNKKLELLVRNKILECCLRIFNSKFNIDVDSRSVFLEFNNLYEQIMDDKDVQDLIMTFTYEIPNDNELLMHQYFNKNRIKL